MINSYAARPAPVGAVLTASVGAAVGGYALIGASWLSGSVAGLGTLHFSFADIRRVADGAGFAQWYFSWLAWACLLGTVVLLIGALVSSDDGRRLLKWSAFVTAIVCFLASANVWSAMYRLVTGAHIGPGVWLSMAGSVLLGISALMVPGEQRSAPRYAYSGLAPGWYPSPTGFSAYWDGYEWSTASHNSLQDL